MRSPFNYRHLLWVLPAAVLAVVIACSDNPTTPANTGTLSVMIKDSPFTDATALLVTFDEVSAHMSGGDWTKLPFADGGNTRTCDLKRLVTSEDILGTGPLATGHYTQLRLNVVAATIYFANTTTGAVCAPAVTVSTGPETGTAVSVPSGMLILNREFDVTNSTTTRILLDFDGDQSVIQTGNGAYKMTPVINVVSVS
jgi:Domain of unknown function (DUF4382)